MASEGLAAGGAPESDVLAPRPPAPPPPPPAEIIVPRQRVVRQSVKEEPAEPAPTAALLNVSKRTLCFAHAAFHATLVAGASVPIPLPLVDMVEEEVQRLSDMHRNGDAENPMFFEVVRL